jgi:hypothetical protein
MKKQDMAEAAEQEQRREPHKIRRDHRRQMM